MDITATIFPPTTSTSSNPTKVKVAVRLRPLIEREKEEGHVRHWDATSYTVQQVDPKTGRHIPNCLPHPFDHVFGTETKTEDLYSKVVAPIVEEAFSGFNGTVLCYGQTSSGKTYTLYGDENEPGIISLTADHLFKRINEDDTRQYFIRVGLLEIYNERVTDLLNSENPIEIKERNGEVYPKDLEEIQIVSAEGMLKAAQRVQRERKIGETRMNKESSRSHTILRISLESVKKEDLNGDEMPHISNAVLNFVDLAGSEKAHQTGATGDRLKEAAAINKSLFTLSQVVMQLSEASTDETRRNLNLAALASHNTTIGSVTASSKKPQRHIKFRDSKLTRILQNSLGGNAYIAMICNITPAYLDESLSTLRFAKTAKKIQTRPQQNKLPIDKSEYEKVIVDLQSQLSGKSIEVQALRKQLAVMSRICNPNENPLSFAVNQIVDRRKTLCPSQLSSAAAISTNVKRCDTVTIKENKLDVKSTLSNSFAQRTSEKVFTTEHKDSFSPGYSEKFMSHSETLEHFRDLTQSRLMSMSDNGNTTLVDQGPAEKLRSAAKCEVLCRDVDVQTTFDECGSPPSKKCRFNKPLADDTPKQTISLARSILAQTIEDDKLEWKTEKAFLEDDLALKNKMLDLCDVQSAETKSKMEKLQQELQKVKEKLTSKDYEVDILFQQNQQKTKLVENLRIQLQEITVSQEANTFDSTDPAIGDQSVLTMENEVKELRESLQLLRSEMELRYTEIEDIKAEKDRANEEKDEEISRLKNELEANMNAQSELDKLRADVTEKTTQIVTLHSELKLKESEVTAALTGTADSSTQIVHLTNQLEESQEKLRELELRYTEIEDIKAEKNNANEKQEQEICKLKKELEAKMNMQSELETFRNDVFEKTMQIVTLQSELKLKDSEITATLLEKDDTSRKITLLIKQLEEANDKLREFELRYTEIEDIKSEKDRANEEMGEEICKLKNELQAKMNIQSELDKFRNEVTEKTTQIVTLQSELKSKDSEVTASLLERDDTSSKTTLLTKQLEEANDKLREFELRYTEIEDIKSEKDRANEEMGEEICRLKNELEAKMNMQSELEKLENDVTEKTMQIVTLQSELKSKDSEVTASLLERDDTSSKITVLTKQLEEAHEKLREFELRYIEIEENKSEKDRANEEKDEEISRLKNELEAKTNVQSELEKFKNDVTEKSMQIVTLQSELKSKDSEVTAALSGKADSSTQIVLLTKQLEESQEMLRELELRYSEDIKSEKDKANEEKYEEISRLKNELEANAQSELDKYRNDVAEKTMQIVTLQSELKSKDSEVTAALTGKADSSTQIALLTKQLEESQEKLRELEMRYAETDNNKPEKNSTDERKDQEISRLRNQLEAKMNIQSELDTFRNDVFEKTMQIVTLQSELKLKDSEITATSLEKDDTSRKITLLTKQLEEANEKLREFELRYTEIEDIKSEKDRVNEEKDEEISRLKNELEAKMNMQSELEKLENDVTEKTMRIVTLQSVLKSKDSEVTAALTCKEDSSTQILLLTKQLEESQHKLTELELRYTEYIKAEKDRANEEKDEEISRLKNELETNAQSELDKFRNDVAEKTMQIVTLQSELKSKDSEITATLLEKDDTSRKITLLTKQYEEAQNKLRELELSYIEDIKSEKDRVNEVKDEQICRLQNELEAKMNLQSELSKLRNDVTEKTMQIVTLQSELKSKDSEVTAALTEKADSSTQIVLLNKQLEDSQEKLRALELRYTELTEEIKSEKDRTNEEKDEEISRLKNEREAKISAQSELEKLRNDVFEKTVQIATLQSELKLKDSEITTTLLEKNDTSRKITLLTKQYEEAQDKLRELELRYTKIEEIKAEKDRANVEKGEEICRLKNELEANINARSELEKFKNDATKKAHLKSVLINRETQTGPSIDILEHLRNYKVKCKILQKDRDTFSNTQKQQKQQIDDLETKNKEFQSQCEKLKDSLCFLKQEYDSKKVGNLVDSGIQCNYLAELVARSSKGEEGLMPEGFPDIVQIKKENSRLRAQVCSLETGRFKCTCKKWETQKKPVATVVSSQNPHQTAFTSIENSEELHTVRATAKPSQPICFPQQSQPSGGFDYKEYLAKLKSKDSEPSPYHPRKYTLRRPPSQNIPTENRGNAAKSAPSKSSKTETSKPTTEAAVENADSNVDATDPMAWAATLKKMIGDKWSDDV